MILAGDIGGTKTNLALFEVQSDKQTLVAEQTFRSKEHSGLEEIITAFLNTDQVKAHKASPVAAACFGVAGPVVSGVSRTPNLPWVIEVPKLSALLKMEHVRLINDLEATAYGIPCLQSAELVTLSEGATSRQGNAALIAAGTGLGEAMLYWDNLHFHPVASEGGHADFAPRNELEIALLRYLIQRFGHVSYERILSGPGLLNVYSFMRDAGHGAEPEWLAEKMKTEDPVITLWQTAIAGTSELCVKSLDLLVSIYGAEAGNLALKVMAVGGLYVGGGLAPRMIEKLKDGTFMKAFHDKGRLSSLVKSIPVNVILNPKTALLGAARCANLGF